MRSLFLRKTSSKAASKYRAVNEEEDQEDEIPLRDFGFEVRDDFDQRSRALSYSFNGDPRKNSINGDPRKKQDEGSLKTSAEKSIVLENNKETFHPTEVQLEGQPETVRGLRQGEYNPEVDKHRYHDNLTDEDFTHDVQSVTSLYYDEHSDNGNHDDGHETITPSPTDGSFNSVPESPRVMIEYSRSVESSFPEDPTQWLESASTAEEATRHCEVLDDQSQANVRRTESTDNHSAGHGDQLHQEINASETPEPIYDITDMHQIGDDPSIHGLWISHDSNSVRGDASRNEMKVIAKLFLSESEDGTGNSIVFAQAVFPDDPFATNDPSTLEANNTNNLQDDEKEIPAETKELFPQDTLWHEGLLGQDNPNSKVENLNLEENSPSELLLPQPEEPRFQPDDSAGPVPDGQDMIEGDLNIKWDNNEDDVHEEEVGSNVPDKITEEGINDTQSVPAILRSHSEGSSGCYLEDDVINVDESKSSIISGDEAVQDDVNIKESSSAVELSQPLNVDPTPFDSVCQRCIMLEEELMVLKAQLHTETMERNIQDEEILRNMALMKQYIDRLESDSFVIPRDDNKAPRVKSDLEEKLEKFDEEIVSRHSRDLQVDFEPKSENVQETTTTLTTDDPETSDERKDELVVREFEETSKEPNDSEPIDEDREELVVQVFEEKKTEEPVIASVSEADRESQDEQTQFKERLEDLQEENSRLLEELKRTKDLLLSVQDEKREDETEVQQDSSQPQNSVTDAIFRNRIQELEEERELLYIKIHSQEAAVALMHSEENDLKQEVKALKDMLHVVMLNSDVTQPANTKVDQSEQEKTIIKALREELEESNKLHLSHGDIISKLVQRVAELSQDTKTAEELDVHQSSEELKEKIRELEAERNKWRAKSIIQRRTIAKMQQVPGPFLMPIEEGEELVAGKYGSIEHFGSSSHDSEESDDSIYEETSEDVEILSRKRSSPLWRPSSEFNGRTRIKLGDRTQ
jgi:hypothetical protein